MVLEPGIAHVLHVTVTEDLTPPHLLPAVVLATPRMIELMETSCLLAVEPALEDGQTTVGVHVDVSHESAARDGEEVEVRGRLVTVNGRRLTFDVAAAVGDRIIGRGTHQRHVVDRSRF